MKVDLITLNPRKTELTTHGLGKTKIDEELILGEALSMKVVTIKALTSMPLKQKNQNLLRVLEVPFYSS